MNTVSPRIIWWNGRIVPWAEAMVHVTSETALRGTNVFEGLRAYWRNQTNDFAIVAFKEHLDRLCRSATIFCFQVNDLLPKLARGVEDLIKALEYRGNLYLRPTIYLERGDYYSKPDQLTLGTFIIGRPIENRNDQPISCIVSTWQRSSDLALPALAKIGAAYTAFRLARMEAAAAGADEAILLNANGTIAETGGAAVFVVHNRKIVTPPLGDGLLDSITRRIAIELLSHDLGMTVSERSISRSELYMADEVFLCGTLDEIRAVSSIDNRQLPTTPGQVTQAVRKMYLDICEGRGEHSQRWWVHNLPIAT
jgi:branched-chain amino acid aminotransferase